MTFRHLGEVKNGVEEKKEWGNALESYHLNENNGVTELTATLDIIPEFAEHFKEIFPKALDRVRQIAESN
jgi:hypothetical protein